MNTRESNPVFFAVVSAKQLDPSRCRSSNIIAANSENVGSQSHSLRQPTQRKLSLSPFAIISRRRAGDWFAGACLRRQSVRHQRALQRSARSKKPSIGGHFASDLLTWIVLREAPVRLSDALFLQT